MNFTYVDLLFSQHIIEEQQSCSSKLPEELLRIKAIINYKVLSIDDLDSLKYRYESIILSKIVVQKDDIIGIQTIVTRIINKINLLKEEFTQAYEKNSPILSLTFLAAHKIVAKQVDISKAPDHIKEVIKSMQSFCTGEIFHNQCLVRGEVKKLLSGLEEDLMPLSLKEELAQRQSAENKDLPYFVIDFDAYANAQMREILADENYLFTRHQPNIASLYPLLQDREQPGEALVFDDNAEYLTDDNVIYTNTTMASRPNEYITIKIEGNTNDFDI